MKPIILSVKRSKFRMDDARSTDMDRAYLDIRPTILKRDNDTCQFCALRMPGKMEVHHISGEHDKHEHSNLITACRLCHLAHHIGYVGVKNGGVLIRLPGIQQAELNHLVRTLWIGEDSNLLRVKDRCTSLLRTLEAASSGAEAMLGFTDPKLLGDYLLRLDEKAYRRRISILKDIKLLYHRDNFEDHIEDVKALYSGYPISQWEKLAESFMNSIHA
ncbi:HNH endonuclease [Marinobacter shengliensis]|uniref:HNH endonuclease n=1 Tax=Marinobacter shengliensis TaxID=1389223 RepID=UPI0011083C98|nr:HNH endonuclease [Marinobacter shengliensis]